MNPTYIIIALAVVLITINAYPAITALVCAAATISTALDIRAYLITRKGNTQ